MSTTIVSAARGLLSFGLLTLGGLLVTLGTAVAPSPLRDEEPDEPVPPQDPVTPEAEELLREARTEEPRRSEPPVVVRRRTFAG